MNARKVEEEPEDEEEESSEGRKANNKRPTGAKRKRVRSVTTSFVTFIYPHMSLTGRIDLCNAQNEAVVIKLFVL